MDANLFQPGPEHTTVETFVQFLMDDERTSFYAGEADIIGRNLKLNVTVVIQQLKAWGFTVAMNPAGNVRGFTTSSHDRWYGPGAEKTHGGSGAGTTWIPDPKG